MAKFAFGVRLRWIMKAVKTVALTKTYVNGDIYTTALDNVSVEIMQGEFVAIVGSSGSGKTTLLNMIGGLDYPTKGVIFINDTPICDMSEEERSIFRRQNIGFVFQHYNLLPVLTAYENIVLPLKMEGKEIDINFVMKITDSLGITEKLWQMPNTLSGGQQQRVAIARALCTKPAIVLADEPTGNMDSKGGREIITLMRELAVKYNQTIAVVTHNEEIALKAGQVIRMEDGKIL